MIELLVSIAVIAILLALLLPAVQMARESARRTQCRNHLRQMGVAFHNHHDVHGHFPTGGWGAQWVGDPDRGYDEQQPGGWPYGILPFIEANALRDLGAGLTGGAKKQAINEVLMSPQTIFHCPSRRSPSNYPSWKFYGHNPPYAADNLDFIAKTDYAACAGSQVEIDSPYPATLDEGDTTFAWAPSSTFNGVCFQRSTVRIADITDGASQTYLVGEKYLAPEAYTAAFSNGDHHGMYAGGVIENLRSANADFTPHHDTQELDLFRRFGSAHPGGWHVLLGDGSVRQLSYSIDGEIHSRLGSRNGNLPAQVP